MLTVDPPPPHLPVEDDRDKEAFIALLPHFDSVAQVAIRAGWHPAEVAAAMVNWALAQTIESAGVATTLELLEEARANLVMNHRA
jgi:hypothetical protein